MVLDHKSRPKSQKMRRAAFYENVSIESIYLLPLIILYPQEHYAFNVAILAPPTHQLKPVPAQRDQMQR